MKLIFSGALITIQTSSGNDITVLSVTKIVFCFSFLADISVSRRIHTFHILGLSCVLQHFSRLLRVLAYPHVAPHMEVRKKCYFPFSSTLQQAHATYNFAFSPFIAHADLNKLAQLDRRQLATDFLSGLAFLHDLNIVHRFGAFSSSFLLILFFWFGNHVHNRDVKPNNVLISQRYRAVISDFGLCKALKEDQSSFNPTMAGTCGIYMSLSPHSETSWCFLFMWLGWVAPELLKGQRATKAVDIFSAGCVLHYLFHGVHPFGPVCMTSCPIFLAFMVSHICF